MRFVVGVGVVDGGGLGQHFNFSHSRRKPRGNTLARRHVGGWICGGRGGGVVGAIAAKHRKNSVERVGDALDLGGGRVVVSRRVAVVCGATGGGGIFPCQWTRRGVLCAAWLGRRRSTRGGVCAATFTA